MRGGSNNSASHFCFRHLRLKKNKIQHDLSFRMADQRQIRINATCYDFINFNLDLILDLLFTLIRHNALPLSRQLVRTDEADLQGTRTGPYDAFSYSFFWVFRD